MESSSQENPVDVDKVAKSFAEFLKTPGLTSARYDETDQALNIYSEWSYDDISKKESLSFVKMFTVLKSSLKNGSSETSIISIPSTPIPYNAKLTAFSNSGSKKAVLTNASKPAAVVGDESEEHLQIFSREKLLKTYDLKELDKHKGVYTSGYWGSRMVWSQDETKLAYLAEKKIPKASPFFTSYSKLGADKNDNETENKEKKEGKKDAFQVLSLPDRVFPSDLQWVNSSSIIGTGYTYSDWKLGLIFCTNRESRIFRVDIDGDNFQYLSEAGLAAYSPRVRPDSKFVVWQQREITGTHLSAAEAVGLNLDNSLSTLFHPSRPSNGVPLYSAFPQNCWTADGSKLCTVTENEVDWIFLTFNFDGDKIKSVSEPVKNITGIRWIGKDHILASRSSCTKPTHLVLLDVTTNPITIHQVSQPEEVLDEPMKRLVIPGSVSPASLYYGPSGGSIKAKSVPLIVIPHGGPNCVSCDAFSPEGSFWLKLGFGILRINYVGSTGGSTDNSGNLLGKIGVDDVKDCHRVLISLLEKEPSIDPEQIVVYGGSHGGFLGAHLSSSYPETFKAIALINPVTDLSTHVGTTDIPDWCHSQAGVKFTSNSTVPLTLQTLENASIFMECSPIKHVEKVQAPTLLLLGSEDLRVPMSQGMAYYRALKVANKTAEIRLYKDCHSLYKPPHRFDCWMQITLWFLRYLNKIV